MEHISTPDLLFWMVVVLLIMTFITGYTFGRWIEKSTKA